ncbi:Receptor-like cytosolic serine/threonine-protein kinase RBK1 [Morella rubra]|uniref:Receptor-like cytosolic serine/threonine-protein kinase RBK1 n=1 Tax=Morella rubra TaxID=262757 RepID=A0A6A1UVA7_9ROSI|nr:Receptor-like cytosolic serine/threonine-protein kinase RBK1 [Morella rubra]
MEVYTSSRDAEAPESVEANSHAMQTSELVQRNGHGDLKMCNYGLCHQYVEEDLFSSISKKELPESPLGWPLRWRTAPVSDEAQRKSEARNMSVVQWAMTLPSRSTLPIRQNKIHLNLNRSDRSFELETVNSTFNEGDNEEGTRVRVIQTYEDQRVGGSPEPEENFGPVCEYKTEVSSSSAFSFIKESPLSRPGWPLLRIAASATVDSWRDYEARNISVVQWLMSLRNGSNSVIPQTQTGFVSDEIESQIERERCSSEELDDDNNSTATEKLVKELELLIRTKLPCCRRFSYKELKISTSYFSSENLVGEGGCSKVYKGRLPCGRTVAVKILKSYKEAWNDFYSEMDIISTLKHKNITHLIGVCTEDNHLISVYDFFPEGSLEENLHGHDNRSRLPWEVRFKVAVDVAEALNYLHRECSRPVIHRDIKSSNILLSNQFQPQLSDFGLAIWGPKDSTYVIHDDVVGTFGYIAPEYFMQGRVSDKIDVYSFGVVLLELLSGRKPIGSESLKGQRSLVKWAKPLFGSGDLRALSDPKLEGNFDVNQMHRMFLAARLCLSQSARLRPKVSQILQILTGEKIADECVKSHIMDMEELGNQDDDALFPDIGCKQQTDSALLQKENDTSSLSSGDSSQRSAEKSRHFMLKDYFKEREE